MLVKITVKVKFSSKTKFELDKKAVDKSQVRQGRSRRRQGEQASHGGGNGQRSASRSARTGCNGGRRHDLSANDTSSR